VGQVSLVWFTRFASSVGWLVGWVRLVNACMHDDLSFVSSAGWD
jgi:hypothetical protein